MLSGKTVQFSSHQIQINKMNRETVSQQQLTQQLLDLGVTWRPMSRNDLPALVDLAGKGYLADGGLHFLFEPDEITGRYFPATSGTAMGAFTVDEQLVACTSVYLNPGSDIQQAIIIGLVRPDWRGRGIGTCLMRWSQVQAQALLTGATTPVLQIRTESLTEPAARLYLAHGFAVVFEELVMRRDLHRPLPDSWLPPEVTITPWQPDLADQFFQAYEAAFRERPGFPGWTRAEWIAHWLDDDFRPAWSLLAQVGHVPLAFLIAIATPPHGFVVQVGVVPSQRRRGLASALVVETMRRMQADGAASIQLTVNTNNPSAIKTYTALGFVTIGRRARYDRILG